MCVCVCRYLQISLFFIWSQGQQVFPNITTPLCLCSKGSHRPNVNDWPGCVPVEFYSQDITLDAVVSQMSMDFFPGSLADVSVVCGGVLRCLQLLCFQQGPFQATPTLTPLSGSSVGVAHHKLVPQLLSRAPRALAGLLSPPWRVAHLCCSGLPLCFSGGPVSLNT